MSPAFAERLAKQLAAHNPTALMNALQERGLVSDEAVTVSDVPDLDALRALVALRKKSK